VSSLSLISLSLVVVFSVMLLLTVTVFMHRSTEMFVNVFDTRFCFEYCVTITDIGELYKPMRCSVSENVLVWILLDISYAMACFYSYVME